MRKSSPFGSGDNQIENKFAVADYKHHHHTKLTYFRTLLDELLYYHNILFAADQRQKQTPKLEFRDKLLTRIKNGDLTLPHTSPQRTRSAGVPRSKLVPRAEHATCMSPSMICSACCNSRPRHDFPLTPDPYLHRKVATSAPERYTHCFRTARSIRWGVFSQARRLGRSYSNKCISSLLSQTEHERADIPRFHFVR